MWHINPNQTEKKKKITFKKKKKKKKLKDREWLGHLFDQMGVAEPPHGLWYFFSNPSGAR
jgi:hypothetical protein